MTNLDAVADDDPEQVVGVAGVHQGGGGQVRLIPHLEHHVQHVRHDHTKDMKFYIDRERVIFEDHSIKDDDVWHNPTDDDDKDDDDWHNLTQGGIEAETAGASAVLKKTRKFDKMTLQKKKAKPDETLPILSVPTAGST